ELAPGENRVEAVVENDWRSQVVEGPQHLRYLRPPVIAPVADIKMKPKETQVDVVARVESPVQPSGVKINDREVSKEDFTFVAKGGTAWELTVPKVPVWKDEKWV